MKSFIAKILVFSLILCSILIAILLLNRNFANFKTNKNSPILIVGHSHSECAYNDSLINKVMNFSQSGETYFYTYFKTQKLIEQNPNIKTVFIEFSNNQITLDMNDWIWGEKYMSYRFPKYGSFMDINSYSILLNKNPKNFSYSTGILIKNCINNIFTGFKFQENIGGYLYLERNLEDSLVTNLHAFSKSKKIKQELSEYNIEYLRKTVDYLISKNKAVFLIRSPLHNMYEGYSNEEQFQQIRVSKFPDIEFLDFSQFPLSNSEFGDLEHLNHKGATKFSHWLNMLLSNGLLEKNNKQKYIENNMNK